jgi:hypothetical protein
VRMFELHRDVDVTGVSGTGIVAEGVEYGDGTLAVRWLGEDAETVVSESIYRFLRIHGHEGRTRAVFLDDY